MAHIVEGLIEHQRVRTTINRAKEARKLAERLVTIAKQNTLHARRQILSALYSEDAARKMFEKIGPAFSQVNGGYTRIIREGNRPGDGALMVYLEFSKPIEMEDAKLRQKKTKDDLTEKKSKEKKKWEEVPLVKKESLEEKTKKEKEKKAKKEEKPQSKASEPEKTEEEKKKGGFLSTLRKFLKGDK